MIKIRETLRNFHHKQYDLTALAEEGNEIIGYCDYTLFNNEISIQYIEVKPEYRRQNIATQLMDWIHNEYADKKFDYGYTTDLGDVFLTNYKNKENSIIENVQQSLKYLKDNDIDENDTNYIKLKNALKSSLGYLGIFTKFLLDGTNVDELISMYQEIKNNNKYIPFLRHNVIEYQNFETLLDDWANAKLLHDAKKVLSMFYKEFATKSINDKDFKSYAERFLQLPEDKQKMFLKTQKYYKENNVNIDKFYQDFYTYIDASGKSKEEIRKEILNLKKTNQLRVLIDTDDALLIQTNDKDVIQKYGSQSWCIVYSDSYYKQYVDYNLQFLIFNWNVPISSADSLYGVTMSLNNFTPVHGGCQNKLNEAVELSEIEKNCKIEKGYLENYVAAISSNLYHEIDKNLDNFDKIFKKYKDRKELYHFISERLKSKLKNKSIPQAEILEYFEKFISKANTAKIEISDVIDADDLSRKMNFELSLNEISKYQNMFFVLIDNFISLKYQTLFKDDAVFTSFMHHLEKNVSEKAYNKFITYFLNSLTLEKLNSFNYDNFAFAMVSVKSNVKDVLNKTINNYPQIIEYLKDFFNHEHDYLKNFNAEFIIKNQKVLNLSDEKVINAIASIFYFEDNLNDYLKEINKIELTRGADFAIDIRRAVSFKYFNKDSKYREENINSDNARDFCKIFTDAFDLKAIDNKSLKISATLHDVIGKFIVRQKNNKISDDAVEKVIEVLKSLKFSNTDIVRMCYKYTHNKDENEVRSIVASQLLKDKGFDITSRDAELDIVEQFVLDIFYTKDSEFNVKPSELLKISKALKLHYNEDEKAFEFKMSNLNKLKDIIIYDEEYDISLDHKEGEKWDFSKIDDFDNYMKDVSASNQKLLAAKNQTIKQSIVTSAIDIAVADVLYNQLVTAVFEKMFKTGYFKKWSNGKRYKIIDNKYVILLTDKFIKPAILKGVVKYAHNDIAFITTMELMENSDQFIELEESDFDLKYDVKHFNNILKDKLS